jgi:hypothetical protein
MVVNGKLMMMSLRHYRILKYTIRVGKKRINIQSVEIERLKQMNQINHA